MLKLELKDIAKIEAVKTVEGMVIEAGAKLVLGKEALATEQVARGH